MPESTPNTLAPADDLQIALTVVDAQQAAIQHADTKAAVLLGVQAGAAALVANSVHTTTVEVRAGFLAAGGTIVLLLLLVAGLTGSLWQLGRCMWPRLTGPTGHNRFALPQLAADEPPARTGSATDMRDEAWRLAVTLARTAMSKHRAIATSLVWTALTITATTAWLCLAGVGDR